MIIFDHLNNMNLEDYANIRWVQRFNSFNKSLDVLEKYVQKKSLTDLEKPGVIKIFETTFEQAWLTIKDFYEYPGETNIQGSRDAFRLAFRRGLISQGDTWMQMIESRKLTVHTYNEKTASMVEAEIINTYFPLFNQLKQQLIKAII